MATKKSNKQRPILVTGASGFLGKHLVEQLRAKQPKRQIRALVRRPSLPLERLGIELVMGDVTNPEDCAKAVDGVGEVYHLAGFVSRLAKDTSDMYAIHVDGTRHLLLAAKQAGVGRVLVVSTSGTVAVSESDDEVSDEASPYRFTTVANWPYYLSKIYQEQTALQFAQEHGLEVVVVGPSLLLGPGDDRGSSTGDVEKVVRGRLPIIPKGGGVGFVDARDAAAGCILAMERGESGERYLLNGANMTLTSFMGRVARLAGVASPRPWISPKAATWAGRLVEAVYDGFDAEPPLDAQSMEMAECTWYVDSTKAKEKLGWTWRDAQETLTDTVRDIERRHNIG